MVGWGVGFGDGKSVGFGVGSSVGFGVGIDDGSFVGFGEGTADGLGLGFNVGIGVGSSDGTGVGNGEIVGRGEGTSVGSLEGRGVGRGVGTVVIVGTGEGLGVVGRGDGAGIGSFDGNTVGRGDGAGIGSFDGAGIVGCKVGSGVLPDDSEGAKRTNITKKRFAMGCPRELLLHSFMFAPRKKIGARLALDLFTRQVSEIKIRAPRGAHGPGLKRIHSSSRHWFASSRVISVACRQAWKPAECFPLSRRFLSGSSCFFPFWK